MKSLALQLLLYFAVLLPLDATGHEGRPVFVQVKAQLAGDGYVMQWKIPPVMPDGLEPGISLIADTCMERLLHNPGVTNQRLIGKKIYRCAQPPSSMAIAINYPQSNPALSSLIVVYDALGNSQHIFSAPEETMIPIHEESSALGIVRQYSLGGIEHIIFGFDHLLFVLCLMVLAGTMTRILWTVTGFTLAHSVTLILASLNLVAVPVVMVEILIALSIVVLAAEIVKASRTGVKNTLSWRYPVVMACAFGLLHGFGFASVLGDLGLPQAMKITALLFFNLGIELGQILFIAAVLLVAKLATVVIKVEARQQKLVYCGVYLIGVIASYWLLQRFLVIL